MLLCWVCVFVQRYYSFKDSMTFNPLPKGHVLYRQFFIKSDKPFYSSKTHPHTSWLYHLHIFTPFLKSLIRKSVKLKRKEKLHLLLSTTLWLNTSNWSSLTNKGLHHHVVLGGQVVKKTTQDVITFFPTSPDCIIRNLASGRDLVNCQGNQL